MRSVAQSLLPTNASALDTLVASYSNTGRHNDDLHAELTARTWQNPLLASHRRYIEENDLGFGDAAFHSLWLLILEKVVALGRPRLLEIGVYKGQVISLWALLLRELGRDGDIHAISPLEGDPMPASRMRHRWRLLTSARYRERVQNSDFYQEADYEKIIRGVFDYLALDFDSVCLHRGLSTDPLIRSEVAEFLFDVVYVDGDHTYEGARADFEFYATLVRKGGYLVADDAGCDLPGTTFWKGHPSVTLAAQVLPGLGFDNVLNVGHNCVFQRKEC